MAETAQEIRDSITCYVEERLQAMVDLNMAQAKRIEELEDENKRLNSENLGLKKDIEGYEETLEQIRSGETEEELESEWLEEMDEEEQVNE